MRDYFFAPMPLEPPVTITVFCMVFSFAPNFF
jgi:hypothetical protein